ncbi:hypothetical protein [Vibrio parahaemolyticus]|uniref:hypothetical protein n=1 Tax=Vibrio parahaemolyticus TaxID=670 RepID=UPI00215CC834|nr:hypothetical protein [Vibrio parahaemolyticus]EGQ8535743.1 hypothetical protein [Vibrio parahaemolyticus]EJB8505209.1 hypothetical protein [Vibrio parahaemolyticus]EJL3960105.1 hypothetical protein [Vibrio parahaemolyticus]MCR9868074.1 hypothetical protein [Vibrio parahaemolyticus]
MSPKRWPLSADLCRATLLPIGVSALVLFISVKAIWQYWHALSPVVPLTPLIKLSVLIGLSLGSVLTITAVLLTRWSLVKANAWNDNMERWIDEGLEAFNQAIALEDNPYQCEHRKGSNHQDTDALCWEEGWKSGHYAMLKEGERGTAGGKEWLRSISENTPGSTNKVNS